MTEKPLRFIVVDDDPINNILCQKVILKKNPGAEVMTFTQPEAGLAYLLSNYSSPDAGKTILFLDINMPTMTGWEFIEQFERFYPIIKEQISIYILSSSVNHIDKEKAKNDPDILGYIEKPLSVSTMDSLVISGEK